MSQFADIPVAEGHVKPEDAYRAVITAMQPYHQWCKDNFVGKFSWHQGPRRQCAESMTVRQTIFLVIEEEEDMVLFKLRWNWLRWKKTYRR